MKKILVLNSGSSSLKFQLFDADGSFEVIVRGSIERIGLPSSIFSIKPKNATEPIKRTLTISNHKAALDLISEALTNTEMGILSSLQEIIGIGHRIVHGGEKFHSSVIVTDEVINTIEECCALAPLHNPPNLTGIQACMALMPEVPQVAVFDTAFHQTMPPAAYMYAIDYEQYEKYGIRRYGFHGSSHRYVSHKTAALLKKDITQLKIITCHLGNGCSISAVKHGKCIDTSMGLTPLEGIPMGTRPGDMDPYIPLHLMTTQRLSLKDVNTLLNKKSGLTGLCGKSDMRDIHALIREGDNKAKLAHDVFSYRIAKYIGSYITAMNGVDAITFTAGIGEQDAITRNNVMDYFTYMGIEIDPTKNKMNDTIISTEASVIHVMVVPTNEELVIAKDTAELLGT